jgi:hypothetical protein
MKEDIMRMAREAGFGDGIVEFIGLQVFVRFAALVAAAEREACARECDDISSKYKWPDDTAEKVASQWCADRIRARGQV